MHDRYMISRYSAEIKNAQCWYLKSFFFLDREHISFISFILFGNPFKMELANQRLTQRVESVFRGNAPKAERVGCPSIAPIYFLPTGKVELQHLCCIYLFWWHNHPQTKRINKNK